MISLVRSVPSLSPVARKAIGSPEHERHTTAFGDAPWLTVFDDDDLATFVAETESAILDVLRSRAGPLDRLRTLAEGWRTTATALSDPVSREILLGRHDPDDFVEVPRPE